ncbi:uncharacterized protein LOC127814199 isoform X3 [Diospyros lotus]|uniref:uncharacterized protein LOC127814199 isoform X3 n=1 Tax=Diospyros lotus TaxID=55363 RepID=UPI00225610FB|nr:uncharacterized protein LOC127814199 isoform X3 [Diospyros lotus]
MTRDRSWRNSPEPSDSCQMVAGESPDWLPAGWTEQFVVKDGREIKHYFNTETGQKFYSKKDLIRYVGIGNVSCKTPEQKDNFEERCSKKKPMRLAMKTNETPEWLPPGWIMELKAKSSGKKYKCYVDPVTGNKFYSKPEVSRYLNSMKDNSCVSQQIEIGTDSARNLNMDQLTGAETSMDLEQSQNMETPNKISCASEQNEITFSKQSLRKGVIVMTKPEELPLGWIKEVKMEKKGNGIRKDPYYTDPVTGYVFRSMKDALRYVETGDISRCAIKPKKREQIGFLNGETSLNMDQLTGVETSTDLEGSQILKTPKEICCASKHNEITFREQSLRKAVTLVTTPHELPAGWIKEIKTEKKGNGIRKDPYYTDPVSGYVFRSMKDALRYVETGDISTCANKPKKREEIGFLNGETSLNMHQLTGDETSMDLEQSQNMGTPKEICCVSEQKQVTFSKQFLRKGVVVMTTPDKLPPGWIKEIKIQRKQNGIRKDPYYTDPVSGYVFFSMKDAVRYVETGDISRCATKPKKREEMGFLNGETSLNMEQLTGVKSTVDLEQSQNLKIPKGVSCAPKQNQITFGNQSLRKVVMMATPDELPPGWTKEIKYEKKEDGIRKDPYYTDPVSRYVFRSLKDALRYVETGDISRCAIKPRKRDDIGFLNEETSRDSTETLLEEKSIENDKRKNNSSSSSNECRSSKRLAGLKPEMAVNLALGECVLNAAARNSGIPCLESLGNVTQSSSETKKPPEEQQIEIKHKEDAASRGIYSFGDSWSDPCLEFAVKTLTGAIPVWEDLANEDDDPWLSPPKQSGISSPVESPSGLQLPVNHPGNVPRQPSSADDHGTK